MMEIRFLAPWLLWGLVLVPLLWWWPRRLRNVPHGLLRTALFAALLLALARPVVLTTDGVEHHVFVIDRSASVDAESQPALREGIARALEQLPDNARVTRVDVGGAATGPLSELFDDVQDADPDGSDLPRALLAAARAIPRHARGSVTVCTDSATTDGEWGRVCQELTGLGVVVHHVPLPRRDGDVFPVAVGSREPLRVGATAEVEVEVVGTGEVTVALEGEDGPLAAPQSGELQGRGLFVFEFEPSRPGFLPVEARVSVSGDRHPDNQTLATEFAVLEPLRVLYLGQRLTGSGASIENLLGPGFALRIQTPNGDRGIAAEDLQLDEVDVVFLDDCPARAIPEDVQQQIVTEVRERGLGLLFAGGRAAFGPGGYHDTPLAAGLPVEFVQKEEKRDPSTTLVLIIDTSGSMGGMRVTLAKEVSRLAMKRLLPHDKVGIVEFYGAKRWAAPIQPASNLIELQRALNRLDSGGGTVILPAIEEAFYGLQNVDTRYKHVLILTDGGVESGAFEPLLRRMADKGINTSTVLIGPEAHSEFLVTLANWGKGRFYNVPNRFNIPELILKQPASAQLPAYRPGMHMLQGHGGQGWWGEVDWQQAPPLRGYVETRARPGATTLLETAANKAPVLASWRYGLGRTTALTTEAVGPGTADWQNWQAYGSWLGRVLTRTARDRTEPFAYSLSRHGDTVTLTAVRRLAEGGEPEAQRVDEAGTLGPALDFRQRSLLEWQADWLEAPDQPARVLAGTATRLLGAPSVRAGKELQVDPRRAMPVAKLANSSGGETVELAP
ncbi:MAG: VWA domain-containing protein, partial [Planctomycetota bacterium]|nr:VWA domain-containing protein [Planctomycetota bacterium]